ncbi:response regulator, partial [Rhizobium sp. BK212]|uniref:response regulator n=1 Tax=Rhizobium sp. BK212 TaxID=2587074 RepID=UPI001AEE541A
PPLTALEGRSHGSILNGNYAPNRLSSAWKPTITALEEGAVEVDAVQAGCIAYLHKPFPGALLINAVNKALVASTFD